MESCALSSLRGARARAAIAPLQHAGCNCRRNQVQWALARGSALMERAMRMEEVLNQSPPYVDVDLYDSDRPLRDAVAANRGERDASELSNFGKHWGTAEVFELARAANEHPPELKAFDAKGFRRDVIEFHPAYHQFMTESIAAGLATSTWREDATPAAAPAQVLRAARFYMVAQI